MTGATPYHLKPRWRKVISDLWGDKTRTLLVVASITVGVFAVGMIISAYVVLGEDINLSYAAANPPNIEIWTDLFDQELVKAIEKVPGVEAAKGASITSVRARREGEAWQTLELVGVDDFSSDINRVTPIEGVSSAGASEIVVSQDFLHVTGFRVGDPIELAFADESERTVLVAGLITDQTKSKPDPGALNYAAITLQTLDDFGQSTDFNRLYITVEGDGSNHAHIAAVAARVKDRLEKSRRSVYRSEEQLSTVAPIESLALTILGILGILGGLTTVLSSSLIINMLNALLTHQMRQIGVMKLIGGRSRQVMGMYLALISAYGLIALALGVPLGALAGYGLASYMATTNGAALQGFRIIPAAVAVQGLMAFLVPLAAGFYPVNQGARTSVQQAISSYHPSEQFSSRSFAGWGAQWPGRVSRPVLVSFRNTFRKKGRLLLTIFTLTIAGAVFMAVFNIRSSLDEVVAQLIQHFMGDLTLEFRREYRVTEIQQTLLEVPGVQGVEGWSAASGEVWDEDDRLVPRLSIIAPPQDTRLLHLTLTAGRWLLPGEDRALVVSDTIYQYYPELQSGDQLTIKLPARHKEAWTVVGIFPFLSMFGDPIAYAGYDFIADRNFTPNQASAYRIISDARDATSQVALIHHIEQHLAEHNLPLSKIQSGAFFRGTATSAVNTLIIFLLVMAILIAVVGSIGLTGTMSMNVLERRREIGVMRAIGASDGVIMQSVIAEALLIGLITWVLAIGLSLPISSLLAGVIGKTLLQSALPLHFTPLGVFLWLVMVSFLSVVASVIPAWNAARLTINEVLAYE